MRGTGLRRTAMPGAALLAGCLLLASCTSTASAPVTSRATGQPRPTGLSDQTPPPGSRTQALQLAESLVAHVALPPGSARVRGPEPPVLRPWDPSGLSAPETVEASGLWTSPASTDQVSAFASAHPPAGTRFFTQFLASPSQTATQVDDLLTTFPPGIANGAVAVLIASGSQGGSVVRVNVIVGWYPPRSAAERVPPGMRAVTVSVTIAAVKSRIVSRTFTSAEMVGRLAALLNGMNASPSIADRSCAALMVTYRLAFATTPGARPSLIATTGVCGTVAVVAHGTLQPLLSDQTGTLSRTAASLLGVKPPFA